MFSLSLIVRPEGDDSEAVLDQFAVSALGRLARNGTSSLHGGQLTNERPSGSGLHDDRDDHRATLRAITDELPSGATNVALERLDIADSLGQ